MAVDTTRQGQRIDIYDEMTTLRSRTSLGRTLTRELLRARKDASHPYFTPAGVRNGKLIGYIVRLIFGILVGVIFCVMLAYIPFHGEGAIDGHITLPFEPFDAYSVSREDYSRFLILATVAAGYLGASLRQLRIRGWLITMLPLGAVLYALHYAFF